MHLDPFWDLPLAKQPEVIDTTNAADSRGSKQCLSVFGKWVMKHKRFEHVSMALWLLVLRFLPSSVARFFGPSHEVPCEGWPMLTLHLLWHRRHRIWPDYCCHCRQNDHPHESPFNAQLPAIDPNWNDLEWWCWKVTPNSFKFWCHGVFSRAVKTFTYIMYRLDIINVNALKVEDGQCDKASQFLSTS